MKLARKCHRSTMHSATNRLMEASMLVLLLVPQTMAATMEEEVVLVIVTQGASNCVSYNVEFGA